MKKVFLLSFLLPSIAFSQNQISTDKVELKNNNVQLKTIEGKLKKQPNLNSSTNIQLDTEKKEVRSTEEKTNANGILKELPTFYYKTRKLSDATYYTPCKNQEGEYMFVLYVKDKDNTGTLDFHDGKQKHILPYDGVSKEGDKYIFNTKAIPEFGNKPMNVQLLLVGDDLTVTFLHKETGKTLDEQTFVTEEGTQKCKAEKCP